MKRTVVNLTCDACTAWKGAEVTDGVVSVPVPGGQTVDLCPAHHDATRRVFELVAEWGVTPERSRRSRAVPADAPRSSAPEVVNGHTAPQNGHTAPQNRRGGKRARERRERAQTATHAPYACPLCGHAPPSGHALTIHFRSVHNMTGGDVYGGRCPLCTHDGTPNGLGVHARAVHGVEGEGAVAALFAQATATGDPYGVLAARAEDVAATASRLARLNATEAAND
jgi:hypothetical protein